MRNPAKYVLLLFALVLSYAGAQVGSGGDASQVLSWQARDEAPQGSLSGVEQRKSPGLQQTEEQVSLINHFPSPPSKHQHHGFAANLQAFEVRLQAIALQYMWRAKAICRGLTSSEIIFPFHYFW
ncbi:hypothetical protein [Pontibacter litorisediminis]|uniref:hypothetical protein n=1 Tax=Pontibacter litorisediminis TaxID=1846260 RepID=UPI0023ECF339|nr:hypothetical protein [Pontibacter litorisediminis]